MMKKINKFFFSILFLILNIIIFSCGIPTSYLSLNKVSILSRDLPYSFSFTCNNLETYFKGYNIVYKVGDEITEHQCSIRYGYPEVFSNTQDPLIPIKENKTFFKVPQTIKVYLDQSQAPIELNVDSETGNPLEIILFDVNENQFINNPNYKGKKVLFIIRPFGVDSNGKPLPVNDTSSNKIEINF